MKLRFSIRTLLASTFVVAVSLTLLLIATKDYRERMALRAELLSDGADYAHVNRDRSIRLLFAHEFQSFDFAKYDQIESLELQGFQLDSESLPKLAELKHVDVLMLQSCTIENAQALTPLARVGCIDSLLIWNTPIKDDAIDSIAGLLD